MKLYSVCCRAEHTVEGRASARFGSVFGAREQNARGPLPPWAACWWCAAAYREVRRLKHREPYGIVEPYIMVTNIADTIMLSLRMVAATGP